MKSYLRHLSVGLAAAFLVSCGSIKTVERNVPEVRTKAFKSRLEQVGGSSFSSGNKVESLFNGDAYFPRMLTDIRNAKSSVEIETFIMMKSNVTDRFVDLLVYKAKRGVDVKVLLDSIGSRMLDQATKDKMIAGGVKLELFRPWGSNPLKLNNRTHRKFLIVDESVCYIGGSGFADAWRGKGNNAWSWRDNQYRITGPAVKQARKMFYRVWNEVEESTYVNRPLKLPNTNAGLSVQVIDGDPFSGKTEVARSLILALNAAKKEVDIAMAYTCPPRAIKQAIIRAHKRGVKVRILSSGHIIDSRVTRRCAHHYWKTLIKLGVEVYEYQPAMMHAKVIVVDRYLTMTGAANMDYRSYLINEENNFHVLDSAFAEVQVRQFEKDLKRCKKLKLTDLEPFALNAWFIQSQL